MESVRPTVVSTGGEWTRFIIVRNLGEPSSNPLFWDGTQWVPERQKALLYANPQLAEQDVEKLKARK
jgi:hypothetical protein